MSTIWCPLQGRNATESECVDSCAAPEQRPVCAMEFAARLEGRCPGCEEKEGHWPTCPFSPENIDPEATE